VLKQLRFIIKQIRILITSLWGQLTLCFQKENQMKILRLKQVLDITGLSRSTIYAYISDGLFPKQIAIGERAVGWTSDDIDQWLNEKINK